MSPADRKCTDQMRRAVFQGVNTIEIEPLVRGSIGEGDVRLRVDACGVCGSDVTTFFTGHYVAVGQVMGHEITGTVCEVGKDVQGLADGDRVMVMPMRSCGQCWYCRRGEPHLCGRGNERSLAYGRPGGFADEIALENPRVGRDVIHVGADVSQDDAVWAEPLAVAMHGLARSALAAGSEVLVIGAGPLGLCVIAAARAAGATPHCVEPRPARRQAALQAGAVTAAAPGESVPPVEAVYDTSGVARAIHQAIPHLRPGGGAVLLGLGDTPLEVESLPVRMRGSFAYKDADFAHAAALINSGAVRLGDLVTHRFALEHIAEAITAAATGEDAVKVTVNP